MTNLLQRGATWLGSKLQTAGGRAVVYRRGSRAVGITATPQMHRETVVGKDGLPVEVIIYSWTITAADLVLTGELEEPQEGDTIEETANGSTYTFKVLPIDDARPAVEAMDSSVPPILWLVHTKRV